MLARSSIVSELVFIVSFVWVTAIYCFLNQACELFLEFPAHPNNTCMYCMPLLKFNKLCKRFYLNPTNPVARRRQKKWLRFVEMDQMEWSRLGGTWERTNNFCCQGLDWQPSLCNNSCLCLSVEWWQVMMVFSFVFSNNLFFAPVLHWITFPCCFPDLNLPKTGPQDVRFFDCFFFLWCWYCVSFPWVSEVEIEIAVTKTNCMYTASSKVVQETSSSWLAIISF